MIRYKLDISISMTYGVCSQYLTCKFIDAYAKYDRRFVLLCVFAKVWMKSKKTDENERYFKMVFPNSCTTVLLVVFFMKFYKLLPDINIKHREILGEDHVTWAQVQHGEEGSMGIPNQEVANWKKSNYCGASVGTLFILFLDFYANVANFNEFKMNIGKGRFVPKPRKQKNNRIKKVDQIIIEDVIDKHNTAESVTQAGMLKVQLKEALETVIHADRFQLMERLMSTPFKDISEYSQDEIRVLRSKGLYCGPNPWNKSGMHNFFR